MKVYLAIPLVVYIQKLLDTVKGTVLQRDFHIRFWSMIYLLL